MKKVIFSLISLIFLSIPLLAQDVDGTGPGGNKEITVQIFPSKAEVAPDDSVKFEAAVKDTTGIDIEDAIIVWDIADPTIGSIDETGLFIALLEGETIISATYEEYSDEADVTVSAEGLVLPEGVNTISIQRQFPDGKITKFGSVVAEGDTATIGGMPFPFNYLNGMKLHFPENSLSEDITITVKIPEFGHVNNDSMDVEYDFDYIITGVTFEVSVDGVVVEPYEFDVPIEVMLPYKKGLLTKLGIIVDDLDMYYVGQLGELSREGIGGVEADEDAEILSGKVAHFSSIVVAPKEPGSGNKEITVQIFPSKAEVAPGDSVKFEAAVKDTIGVDIEDAIIVWDIADPTIGSIDETGLFIALLEGETTISATYEDYSDEADVTVSAEGLVLPEGVNTISIQRQFPDGKITKFGSVVAEGDTATIGGMPFPFNYLNGMKLYFPENSLSEDITITVKIPAFGHVNNDSNEIEYDFNYILTGVTFEVSVDGVVVEPFEFDTPIEVMLPYKKGLLTKLGVNIEDLDMYYVGQLGELTRDGIGYVEVDDDKEVLSGKVAHFSNIAVAVPQEAIHVMEMKQDALDISQNYPNPFNPITSIDYKIPETSHIRLTIYNMLGQHVRTLVSEVQPAGKYTIVWDGRDDSGQLVNSGVYIYQLKAGQITRTRNLLFMK
ncbi:Ig-like domain-containing protein [Candidatus Latescibacterota bacterium]